MAGTERAKGKGEIRVEGPDHVELTLREQECIELFRTEL